MRFTPVVLASVVWVQVSACQPAPEPPPPGVAPESAPEPLEPEIPAALPLDCASRPLEAEVLGTIDVGVASRAAFSRDLVVHGNQLHVIAGYHDDPCGISDVYRADLAPWQLHKLAPNPVDSVHVVFGLHRDADHLVWGESPGCGEVQRVHRMAAVAAPATAVDRPIGYAPFLAHAGWLHWTNDRGALMRLSFASGADEALGPTPAPSAPRLRAVFAVDPSGIYAAETGPPANTSQRDHLVHVSPVGGPARRMVPLLPESTVYRHASNSEDVLVLAGSTLGGSTSHLLIAPKSGARATVRAFAGHVGKAAIAGGHAYAVVSFPSEDGRLPSPAAALVKVPLDGRPTELLGCSDHRLSALAIDGDQLYFTADQFRGGLVTASRRPL